MNRFVHGRLGHFLQEEAGDGGSPSGGADAAPAAAPDAAATTEQVQTPESSSLFGTEQTTEQTPTEQVNTEATEETGEKKDEDGEKKDDEKPLGAPEAYEAFTLPEGVEIADEVMPDVHELFKDLNLPQDQAQQVFEKLLAIQDKIIGTPEQQVQRAEQQIIALNTSLAEQCKQLPDIGGEKFAESLATASRVMQQFGDKDLRSLIALTGVGSHPAFFKMMVKIGTMMSPDTFEQGGETPQTDRRPADVMFGHLFKQS